MTLDDKPSTPSDHAADRVALITGGSAGLGLELVRALADRGWAVLTDARHADRLREPPPGVHSVAGDVADPDHRAELVAAVRRLGRLDLLVHNASTLGPLPLRPLADLSADDLQWVWSINAAAPHALSSALVDALQTSDGVIIAITSDAAVEHYETWGGYGATKLALEHLTLTLGVETGIPSYVVDPGDMRTAMHADAFPGEDISDRPLPSTVVPALLGLVDQRPPAGRYRAVELTASQPVGASA